MAPAAPSPPPRPGSGAGMGSSSLTLSRSTPPPGNRTPRKVKKRKDKDKELDKEKEREREMQVVTLNFADNTYTGVVRQDGLGSRFLEGPAASYTWRDGTRYEGPFVASQIEGRGKFFWPDGSRYEGEILNGKRHGEGLFVAPDGITKYEGQWREGKRHGAGRLTYDALGESFYQGEWQDGQKHGQGLQVWPSRNVYQGQWRQGRMSGEGTMTWCDGGRLEQYKGCWEDNKPQGEGAHVWHALAPKADGPLAGRDMPSQQMNNCYAGQWKEGLRHGSGTFNYANGAKYSGTWVENIKHGEGRYTFEDGRVFAGPFTGDQMGESASPAGAVLNRPVLNIGAEDNPVRRCIDISDLEVFALPVDVGRHDFDVGSGYDEPDEVMREVHNMLLRHLGELKRLYCEYRAALRRPGCDPFVLSMHQLWLLARDLDLVTPGCPLSRLDRFVCSGPRHHGETANADLHEIRPLTPRGADIGRKNADNHRLPSMLSAAPSLSAVDASRPSSVAGSEASSAGSRAASPAPLGGTAFAEADAEGGVRDGAVSTDPEALQRCDTRGWSRGSGSVSDLAPGPLFTRFWRKEGSEDLVDIHSPERPMMFRHFLEAIVRLSLARFPNEKGLEHQMRCLVKEKILPGPSSGPAFHANVMGFLVDTDVQAVLQEHLPPLWQLFKENAAGEGGYGRPPWASPPVSNVAPWGLEEDPPAVAPSSSSSSGGRRRRRDFVGQQRRSHLAARLDVTMRIKDLLRLFDSSGLLKPLGATAGLPALTDLVGSIFPVGEVPATPALEADGEASDRLADAASSRRLSSPTSLDAAKAAAIMAANAAAAEALEQFPRERGSANGSLGDAGSARREAPQAAAEDVAKALAQVDLQVSFLELLHFQGEVFLPETLAKLCWAVSADASPKDEQVALLEFLETELTFAEFTRLLVRVAERQTQLAPTIGRLPLAQRLGVFLRRVFLPALKTAYSPPQAPTPEPVPAAPTLADGEEAAPASVPSPAQPEEPEIPGFWRGFDDDVLEAEASVAPRMWPADYEEEVANW